MTLIDAKFDADLINISEVTSHKTKWPRFYFGLPCIFLHYTKINQQQPQTIKKYLTCSILRHRKKTAFNWRLRMCTGWYEWCNVTHAGSLWN